MKSERRYIILYWACYYLLISLVEAGPGFHFADAFTSNLIVLPIKIAFVIVVTEFLAPAFLFRKKTLVFLVAYLLVLYFFAIAIRAIDNAIVLEYVLTNWVKEPLLSTPPLLYNVVKLQFALAIPLTIKLFLNWMDEQSKNVQITQEKTTAELAFLRSQFQPHFMFNALNSLYYKIMMKSDDSADMLLRISSLLRFSLYESNGSFVPLSREVQYIQDYISLQQARFEGTVDIVCTIDGHVGDQKIEPLLIIPLLENSFKFCKGTDEGSSWVTVHLTIEDEWITAQISNSKGVPDATFRNEEHKGIGLANVKQRLELLYKENYTLNVSDTEDSYFVSLKLKLAS